MTDLHITVADKIATFQKRDGFIVCGNSDYQLVFTFDEEWGAHDEKVARFIVNGIHKDIPFSGTTCPVPTLRNARLCKVGVYAGDISTTTPAMIDCLPSILCEEGAPAGDFPLILHDYAGVKKINAAPRNFAASEWTSYGTPGRTVNWETGEGYDNSHIVVGDAVYISGTVSNRYSAPDIKAEAAIYGVVTEVTTEKVTAVSSHVIMGGAMGKEGATSGTPLYMHSVSCSFGVDGEYFDGTLKILSPDSTPFTLDDIHTGAIFSKVFTAEGVIRDSGSTYYHVVSYKGITDTHAIFAAYKCSQFDASNNNHLIESMRARFDGQGTSTNDGATDTVVQIATMLGTTGGGTYPFAAASETQITAKDRNDIAITPQHIDHAVKSSTIQRMTDDRAADIASIKVSSTFGPDTGPDPEHLPVGYDAIKNYLTGKFAANKTKFKCALVAPGATFKVEPNMLCLALPYDKLELYNSSGTNLIGKSVGATMAFSTELVDGDRHWLAFVYVTTDLVPTVKSYHDKFTKGCYIKNTASGGNAYVYYVA